MGHVQVFEMMVVYVNGNVIRNDNVLSVTILELLTIITCKY